MFAETTSLESYDALLANDENFNGEAAGETSLGSSAAFGDLTFTANGGYDIEISTSASGYLGADNHLVYDGDEFGGGTQVTFHTTDGSEFKLESFQIDTGLGTTNYTIKGNRDGSEVYSATLNIGSSPVNDGGAAFTKLGAFNGQGQIVFTGWDDLDEVVMTSTDLDTMLDDIDVSAAVSPNTAPSISLDNATLSYTENASAVQIDGAGTVNDSDGNADWNGGKLEAQVTANAEAGDRISIADTDGDGTAITVSGTDILSNGTDIGDLSASGGTVTGGTRLTITFDSDATNANVQEVLQSLRYDSTSESPGTANRTITVTATDDAAASNSDTRTFSVSTFPDITSATYNASTGTLVVTGNNLEANAGAANDVDVSDLTFTGEGGATYQFTDSADVEIDSATQFTVMLSTADRSEVNQIVNKDGTSSTGGTPYNLAAADDWNTNVTAGDTSDATGNGITASNVAAPTITSATYDASSGALTVTGTGLLKRTGAANDIDASKLAFTGEGSATYTLTDTSDVEITSATQFTVTLSATDRAELNKLVNKNGTTSTGGTTYNLAGNEDWAAGAGAAVNVADTTGNGITVSNVPAPTVTSATYDASTGTLVVTGTGLLKRAGANNDIDASLLTFTGEGGDTYQLTDSSDVEITSGTAFTVTLSATDKAAVNQILNKDGTSSTGGTTYNLAAAEDWTRGADAAVNVADTTGNGMTVSNVAAPTITSAAYNASTGVLMVAGTGLLKRTGVTNDIDASQLTFTGEGGDTYQLTDSSDVEITLGMEFTVTLSATDKAAVNQILNKDGTSSTGGTTYNLSAAEDWARGADAAVNVADTTGNGMTVSNVPAPTISSAAYDYTINQLVVTGTGFLKRAGAANDIDVSMLSFTGEGGGSYSLITATDVEIDSATQFTVTLSGSDITNVEALLNNDGMTSVGGTAYNLAAAEDWVTGADAAVNVADTTGNGITVSNYAAPTVTSATYDVSTGQLVITGTDLINQPGAANDIDASLFTLTGEGGSTYTLTDTSDTEITSSTQVTLRSKNFNYCDAQR